MSDLFKLYLSLSISGSVLVAILLCTKEIFKKYFSKSWQYYIWIIVLLRLLVPFSLPVNFTNQVIQFVDENTSKVQETRPTQNVNYEGIDNQLVYQDVNPEQTSYIEPDEVTTKLPIVPIEGIAIIWLMIANACFIYKVIGYATFRRKLLNSCIEVTDERILALFQAAAQRKKLKVLPHLYVCAELQTPIYMGLLKSVVILPVKEKTDIEHFYSMLHELTHYKRMDAMYSWLVQITVCVHWFNPLVYLMQKEIEHKCELSCDEVVINKMDARCVREYGDTLLSTARECVMQPAKMNAMAFGEKNGLLKERILSIMNFKKTNRLVRYIMVVTATVLCVSGMVLGGYSNKFVVQAKAKDAETVKEVSKENKADKDPYDLSRANFFFNNEEMTIVKPFYWNSYVYEMTFSTNEDKKTKYDSELTLDDESTMKIYFKSGKAKEELEGSQDLNDLVSKVKKASSRHFEKPLYCIVNRYKEVGTDFAAIAKDAYKSDDVWIFAPICCKLDNKEQKTYLQKAYNDDNIVVYSLLIDYMDKETKYAYVEKSMKEDMMAYFSMSLDDLSPEQIKTLKERAYSEDNVAVFSMLSDKLSAKEKETYLDKAYKDDKIAFLPMILDKMDEKKIDEMYEKAKKEGKTEYQVLLKGMTEDYSDYNYSDYDYDNED